MCNAIFAGFITFPLTTFFFWCRYSTEWKGRVCYLTVFLKTNTQAGQSKAWCSRSNIHKQSAKIIDENVCDKQLVLMHGHQGWNVRHGLCHIYMRYVYIYIWVAYSLCFFCCLFITVTWWYVWCIEWASGNQEEVQACLVTLWLFIISCYSLYKTTLGFLCSWFENNPHFHKYSMDFHV